MTDADLTALKVGWIGTGRMGFPLAQRLLAAGVPLSVWNRTRAKAEPLAAEGATVAERIVDLADCEVVFTMVAADADLEQVVLGAEGLLSDGVRRPDVIVDCSTVSAETSARVRAVAADREADFIAAPVSGNGKVVAAGRLTLVCSGAEPAFVRVRHLLELLGRHVTYVGDAERARLVKICHNLMLGIVAQTMAEITVLAEKGGVSRAAFLDFLNNSVMGSTFSRYKAPAYVNLDFTPTFTPLLLRKDFELGLAAARELGVPMPVSALTHALVQSAVSQGRTEEDFAVLLELQAVNSGLRLEPEDAEVDDGLSGAAGS
jgi:3-hydroxyisobutyrate dehydrogenase